MRILVRSALGVLCALAGCLVLGVPMAPAAITHKYLTRIAEIPAEGPKGEPVPAPGPLNSSNSSMTVDSGDLWVSEYDEDSFKFRADEFDATTGAFISQLPQSGPSFQYLGNGVAVGHVTGESQLYVGGDTPPATEGLSEGGIAVYNAKEELQKIWSGADTPAKSFGCFSCTGPGDVAVDDSTSLTDWAAGDVYVSAPFTGAVDVFKPEAKGGEKYVTQLLGQEPGPNPAHPFEGPYGVAVSAVNGDVLVVDGTAVDVFEPTTLNTYVFVRRITGAPGGSFGSIPVIATDNVNGDVYISETGLQGEGAVDEFGPEGVYLGRMTGSDTPTGSFGEARSLAVDPATHNVYVFDRHEGHAFLDIFGENLVVPNVTTGAASNVKPYSATVAGTVDPVNAGTATCEFVWGTTTTFGEKTPCSATVPNGEGAAPVTATIGGLQPDTTYHYRLEASNANYKNVGETSQDQEFTTAGPGIHEVWASDVASSSATLYAKIDPHSLPTTYYFEYGTSAGHGTDIPLSPGAGIGSEQGNVEVSQHIQGLLGATAYHYRVVAISEVDPGEYETFDGSDKTFLTQAGAAGFELPDGRAWEMVSSPNKHGAGLETPMTQYGKITQASVSGGAIAYAAYAPTEEQPQGNRASEPTQLLSRRTANGWETKAITTPFARVGNFSAHGEYRMFSPDLSESIVYPFAETALSSDATERTPYLRDNETCEASPATCYTPLVTAADVEPGLKFGEEYLSPVAATPDLSHVILTTGPQKGNYGKLLPGGSPQEGEYEWYKGSLQSVTILPDEEPAEYGNVGGNSSPNVRHAVSDDGSHVVFSAELSSKRGLYTRDMMTDKTVQVDAVEPGAAGGSGKAVFQLASSDGSKIFFTDTARLTVDSTASEGGGGDLYEFNLETGKLTDLTVDTNQDESADLVGVVQGASEDDAYIYFVANGVLAANVGADGSHATPGGCRGEQPLPTATCNLYVRHAGVTTYIAALSAKDQNWSYEGSYSHLEYATARVSPNGGWFTFMSDRSLTGYDNHDANSGEPDEEVFLYDASTNHLSCVSCNQDGARPVGMFEPEGTQLGPLVDSNKVWQGHWLAGLIPGWYKIDETESMYQSRYLSNGGRLFFMSNEGLVPQDVNGTMDVYEYEPPGEGNCTQASATFAQASGGCIDLISSGGSAEESVFMDANENGDEAFFLTASKLSSEDYDNALDMYDARVCSSASPCLPAPPANPPPCTTGDSCKPAPSPQPTIFGAAPSATFSGIGNVVPEQHQAAAAKKPLTRAQKLAQALRVCARKHQKRKRAACVRQARRRYGAKSAKKSSLSTTSGR
jgi:hypothetical protein